MDHGKGRGTDMKRWTLVLMATMLVLAGITLGEGAKAETSMKVTEARFGAVPDDGRDDAEAIQKALELGAKTNETLVVTVPKGHYQISDTLVIYSNTKLILESGATISCLGKTHLMLINGKTTSDWPGGYGRSRDIVVQGGTWDGNGQSGNAHSDLMFFAHAENITIQNVDFVNCCGNHFIEFAAVRNGTVNSCSFKDFIKYNGLNYDIDEERDDVTAISEAIQIDYASGIGTDGGDKPADGTLSQDITVNNCTFDNCMSGVGNHHISEKMTQGLKIANNRFSNMQKDCVNFYSFGSTTISGNTATNVRRFLYSNSSRATENGPAVIENNTISNTDGSKKEDAIQVVESTSLVIRGNEIHGFSNGVFLDRAVSTSVTGNTISEIKANGIKVQKSTGPITGNTVTNCGESGISLSKAEATSVADNTISGIGSMGIIVQESNIQITGNTLTNCGEFNIMAYSTCSGTIEGNTYDLSYGIRNNGKMIRGANIWKDHEAEPTWFMISYYLDENAPASEQTTLVEVGVETKTLTVRELGFAVEGKLFKGWKVYREDTKEWKVKNDWADAVATEDDYLYFRDGEMVSKTAEAGVPIRFIATWVGQGTDFLPGDVNGDGVVDGRDAIRLRKYLANKRGGIDILLKNANLTEDNEVNKEDLMKLLEYLAGELESL